MERSKIDGSGTACRHRFPLECDDHIDCTEGSCRSCAAVSVASCVALGCCPCAAVNMLSLTLVKVPLAVSRRCLRLLLKRRRRSSLRRRVRDEAGMQKMAGEMGIMGRDVGKSSEVKFRSEWAEMGILGIEEVVDTGGRRNLCSIWEAEKMWMELYQVGHWGFGRVSFSGNLREGHLGNALSGASQNAPATFDDDVL